jgi:hypothetical protein
MKKILFFLLVIAGCTSREMIVREEISLAGTWQFKIDSLDIGIGLTRNSGRLLICPGRSPKMAKEMK